MAAAGRPAGKAKFFLGPMFSGKSTEVVRRITRARLACFPCVLVKNVADVRFKDRETDDSRGALVHSHDGFSTGGASATSTMGRLRVVVAGALLDVELAPDELDIGVDEGQFYPDLRAAVDLWTREGRRVYVAALDGDFRRAPFAPVSEALPLATTITKLKAVCMACSENKAGTPPGPAAYSLRVCAGDAVELVGGRDKYRAVCLACYLALA